MNVWRRISLFLAVVLILTPVMALAPVSLMSHGGVQKAEAAPTFYLPWQRGEVWYMLQGHHGGLPANNYAFDAKPDGGRGTSAITAVAPGKVYAFQNDMPDDLIIPERRTSSGALIGHAGNCIILDHGAGVYSIYAHLSQGSIPKSIRNDPDREFPAGTVIGSVGNSGYSEAPHLHWAVIENPEMYPDLGYETCKGDTIPSIYADPDKELQEDGGTPRTGRYYESFNSPSDNSGAESPISLATLDLDVQQWCQDYYADPGATAYPKDENDPYSWVCDTNGEQRPVDMMDAAKLQYGPETCAHLVGPTAYDWKAGICLPEF